MAKIHTRQHWNDCAWSAHDAQVLLRLEQPPARPLTATLCSDLTEATLTGASLSIVSTVIMVFLLVMVR